jgi:hypothetical protein
MASRAVRAVHPMVLVVVAGLGFAAACHETRYAPPPVMPAAPPPPPPPLPLLTKEEVPPYCQFRGAVSSRRRSDEAYGHLQLQGQGLGATHVVLDGTRAYSGGWGRWGRGIRSELFGRAYWCPPPPDSYAGPAASPAASGLQPASAEICAPACQAGYACVAQACVPVCDPPCAAGQACGPDRVCRAR